jgi:hypothetical protein
MGLSGERQPDQWGRFDEDLANELTWNAVRHRSLVDKKGGKIEGTNVSEKPDGVSIW